MMYTLIVYFVATVSAPWGTTAVVSTLVIPGLSTEGACWAAAKHVKADLKPRHASFAGDLSRQVDHFDCMVMP